MSENYNPILPKTVKAAGNFTKRRFIGFDDLQITTQGNAAKGVAQQDALTNDLTPVTIIGTAIVEAGGAIAAGAYVISDNQGRAIAANALAIAPGATAVTSAAANGDHSARMSGTSIVSRLAVSKVSISTWSWGRKATILVRISPSAVTTWIGWPSDHFKVSALARA